MMNLSQPLKPNRLARLVHQPGGCSIDEAVQAAAANLETIRASVIGEIETLLQRIQTIGATLQSGAGEICLDELYSMSNKIAGMAGVFGLTTLGEVSFSLCELIDRMKERNTLHGPALCLHIDSLRLVRPGTQEDESQGRVMVEALRRVVARI